MTNGFVYLDEAVDGLLCDAKYSYADNFTGRAVDGYFVNRAVGSVELARALNEAARNIKPLGLRLLVWDAYRPTRAVECFMRWAASDEDGKTKSRHYPNIDKAEMIKLGYVAEKSGHSRGSAVDLTLCDASGNTLDMGGIFDFMDESSHHEAAGVSPEAAKNRAFLRTLMEKHGFSDYQNEWWHYCLKNEPYPDTYFNFPIE